MMKKLLITATIVLATAVPALAESSTANIKDHYKTVIEQTPYKVEVCRDVQVPNGHNKQFDKDAAIIGGIIGGLIGNQFGKGSGKEAATGVGALTGAIIAGNQDKGPTGYRNEQQCIIETRYKEVERKAYSHSTATFYYNGRKHTLRFIK